MKAMPVVAYHTPVLVDTVVALLRDATHVLDGTLGGGGHAEALLSAGVQKLVGVDRDPAAIAAARERLEPYEHAGRFTAVQANYADVAASLGDDRFDGILLDLGVSSRQFDSAERGFTFREGAPLDMRMGDADVDAAAFLNSAAETELVRVFKEYGDERRPGRLAKSIVHRRATAPFRTSDDLVNAIRAALGPRSGASDFARIFQAVRIQVNDEIGSLRRALPALRDRLASGGVFAVITYHSGEDRVVKHEFRDWSAECICPPRQPRCTCRGHALGANITKRPIAPSDVEISANPRARSARLRAWRAA